MNENHKIFSNLQASRDDFSPTLLFRPDDYRVLRKNKGTEGMVILFI